MSRLGDTARLVMGDAQWVALPARPPAPPAALLARSIGDPKCRARFPLQLPSQGCGQEPEAQLVCWHGDQPVQEGVSLAC